MSIRAYLSRVTIEPVVLFYVFAIFAEYAVIEDLLYVSECFNHKNLTSNDELHVCIENKKHKGGHSNGTDDIWNEISASTNKALQLYNGILYATSILSSFVAAAYADRRSKLVPILVPIVGSAIVQSIILISLSIETSDGIALIFSHTFVIFICCFVSGITGGTSTLLSNCFAYVAEKCTPEQRTSRITIVEACLFGGGFFGFTYAGAILRNHPNSLLRYYYNFGIFLLIHVVLGIYIILRHSLFVRPIPLDSSNENACQTCITLLTSVLRTIFRKRPHRYQRYLVLLILFAFTLISFWNVAITTMLFIYTRNHPLDWESWMYSYYSSAKFALCGIFLCLLPVGQYALGRWSNLPPVKDTMIIYFGLLSRGLSIILIGLATNSILMIAALVAIILAEYPIPAIRSLISKIIEKDEKTQMFVFMAMIQSICFFVGGIVFPEIYNAVFDKLKGNSEMLGPFNGPGLIFIAMGVLQFIAMAIFIYVGRIITLFNIEFGDVNLSESQQLETNNNNDRYS